MNKRSYHLKRKYGITEEDYDDLLRKQEHRCGVCGKEARVFNRRLAVDHDHQTGEIRGLLCLYCNKYVVGRHRQDTIQAVYNYLVSEYTGWVVPPKKKKKRRRCRKIKKKQSKDG